MHPINECVVKLTARCNINCDYCYEFNLGDESWRQQPRKMSLAVARQLATRIAEHAMQHNLSRIMIGLHGGEPLLAGAKHLDAVVGAFRAIERTGLTVDVSVQTNAILVTSEICEVLNKHNIGVGVSIDGNKANNDVHRVDHRGKSSWQATIDGLACLRANAPSQLSGLLAVIDVNSDPIEVFDAIADLGIRDVDFLLQHFHWDRLPPRPNADDAAYGKWWFAIWQAWARGRHANLRIRFLEQLVRHLAGGRSIYEWGALEPASLVVIASDGAIEGVDAMKSAATGVQRLGYSVFTHTFDEVLAHELVRARQNGLGGLCSTCQACPEAKVCGGGYFPHRWGRGRGYDNPSVYCTDLLWLIGEIRQDIRNLRKSAA